MSFVSLSLCGARTRVRHRVHPNNRCAVCRGMTASDTARDTKRRRRRPSVLQPSAGRAHCTAVAGRTSRAPAPGASIPRARRQRAAPRARARARLARGATLQSRNASSAHELQRLLVGSHGPPATSKRQSLPEPLAPDGPGHAANAQPILLSAIREPWCSSVETWPAPTRLTDNTVRSGCDHLRSSSVSERADCHTR